MILSRRNIDPAEWNFKLLDYRVFIYHLLVQAAGIIRIHMQPVSTVFFFLRTAVSAPLPSVALTNDALARYA